MGENRLTTILGAGIASHVSHSLTTVNDSLMVKNTDVKTIREIMEEEKSMKITRTYNDYVTLYNTPTKKRGSNFTPKKKKRKKDNMEKVPTAEEFLISKNMPGFAKHTMITQWMVEFARLHVEAALKEASEKVSCNTYYEEWENGELKLDKTTESSSYKFPYLVGGKVIVAKKSSILNSYPLENIK